jgi:hypothetical protein
MPFCKIIFVFVRGLIVSRVNLSLELLPLRHQLVVLRRTVQHPQIQNRDRRFWIVVSRIWKDWRQALIGQTRDSDQMASPGLQDVLALEVQIEAGRTSQAG